MRKLLALLVALASSFFDGGPQAAVAEEASRSPVMGMLMLRDATLPNSASIAKYMNDHWPSEGPFKAAEAEDGMVSVEGPDGTVLIAFSVDVPIPKADLQFPCETSMGWSEACSEVEKMRAHAIISSLRKETDPGRGVFLLTAFIQSLSAQSSTLGIYLGEASTVWSPEQFTLASEASSAADPPFLLWMGLKAQNEGEGASSVITMGLPAFGLMNLEVQHTKSDGNKALEFVSDLANYLIANGAIIKDGDTVGPDPQSKTKVTFGPSILDPSQTVYQVHY